MWDEGTAVRRTPKQPERAPKESEALRSDHSRVEEDAEKGDHGRSWEIVGDHGRSWEIAHELRKMPKRKVKKRMMRSVEPRSLTAYSVALTMARSAGIDSST